MPDPSPDLVVVGASFAGAACAIAAAQRGLHVCVLERKRDPGDKLHTTGIIVKEAAEHTLLNQLPSTLVRRIEQVRLYAPSLEQVALAASGYYFLTTDTPGVMRWLAQRMREHGVDLRLGRAFTGCERRSAGWHVEGVGHARYLVGADGARSRVARHCGLGQVRQFLYGVEYEFPGAVLDQPDALHCFISKRYAPGYIGWIAQNPTGIQAGLALRHDPARARVPDIDGFLMRVGMAGGLPRLLRPGTTRAGLIPCSGPVFDMACDRAILVGDAAGMVSPVTAGGIHSAWEHGWAVGRAVAAHLRDGGPAPGQVAIDSAPRFRFKRALRWAYDRMQFDWPFDLLLHSPPLRWAASFESNRNGHWQVYAQPASGGEAVAVTPGPGSNARESVDGRQLPYTKPGLRGLWCLPRQDWSQAILTEEQSLLDGLAPEDSSNWAPARDGVYFVRRPQGEAPRLAHADAEGANVTDIAPLPGGFEGWGFDLSPDEGQLVFSEMTLRESDLRLAVPRTAAQ